MLCHQYILSVQTTFTTTNAYIILKIVSEEYGAANCNSHEVDCSAVSSRGCLCSNFNTVTTCKLIIHLTRIN